MGPSRLNACVDPGGLCVGAEAATPGLGPWPLNSRKVVFAELLKQRSS